MPVPWSTTGPLSALLTLLGDLSGSGLQSAQAGVPEAFSHQVTAYVTAAGQVVENKATGGLMQRELGYRVVFAYAIDGAEQTAETTVCSLIDAFLDALFADRTLGGTLERLAVDASGADDPVYTRVSGEEVRQFEMFVRGAQRKTFEV